MRVGQNPAKSIKQVAQPKKITVATVTYIPHLKGYYAETKFENNSKEKAELFAVSSEIVQSSK